MQYTGLFNAVKPKSYIKINYILTSFLKASFNNTISIINYNKLSTVISLLGDPKFKRGEIIGQYILSYLQSYLPNLIEKEETF
ncbi:unnamed protein product [Fusarium fujikuroi]|uniref:Uncharacterized protein n=1 Tax=Fusarium fujikuroi TaxID=5127 RepID=A0A9Q9U4R2_FUSFU|nr:unnamed protein product [Fusarium fujikuroi]